MALSIPDQQDPQDEEGVNLRSPYGWIADLRISYSDDRASLTFWVHRSPGAAATWPGGTRIEPVRRISITCGDPVPGYPDVTFPEYIEVEDRAVRVAESWHAAATTDEDRAAVRRAAARGGAIRAALYGLINELIFPDATPIE